MIKEPDGNPNKKIRLARIGKELFKNINTIIDIIKINCKAMNDFFPGSISSFAIYAKAIPHPKPIKAINIVKTICYAPIVL